MFAGKTQELIRRIRLAQIARQHIQVFKSVLDKRYRKNEIVSHDQHRIPSIVIRKAAEIRKHIHPATQVVGIDEAHFLGDDLVDVCEHLANEGRRVIVAGLDLDYRGKPFQPMACLMAVAEYVTKNLAICVSCGAPASRSYRVSGGNARIEVGALDKYEARCRTCFLR